MTEMNKTATQAMTKGVIPDVTKVSVCASEIQ